MTALERMVTEDDRHFSRVNRELGKANVFATASLWGAFRRDSGAR